MNDDFSDRLQEREFRSLVLEASNSGDYPGAIALLDCLIEDNPDSAIDYNNRGLMYFYNGQHEAAIADFDRAISLNPRLDNAYNNRANCYAAMGDLASAIADYDIALDFNPTNARAWVNQAITYRELGLYDLAIENFDIALVLGRRLQGRIYAERGRAYQLRGDWNCALGDYQRALESRSSHRYAQRVKVWQEELLAPVSA